jgi:hypothetical protein
VKQIKFEQTVKVAGVLRTAGTVVPASEIPSGNLESLARLGQVSAYDPDAPATGFVEFMEGALPSGEPARPGPTVEDMRKAVEEIDRRGELLREKHAALVAAGVENEALKNRVAELEAAANKPAQTEQQRLTDDGDPNPPVEEKDKPVEAKAKPPTVGPSKPPELKAGKK